MFLVEYKKGWFIDAEDIQWVKVAIDEVSFILKSDPENCMAADADYQSSFVNNLQALNDNIQSVESAYHEANKKPKL